MRHSPSWNFKDRLSIKMPSYLDRDSHYNDKTAWRPSHIYSGGHIPRNNVFIPTQWGWVAHICVSSEHNTIGSDNGLSPGWRQAIIWTNAEILLIGSLGTNFIDKLIYTFFFMEMQLKISSEKWRTFCLGLNVLERVPYFELYHYCCKCLRTAGVFVRTSWVGLHILGANRHARDIDGPCRMGGPIHAVICCEQRWKKPIWFPFQ